MNWAIIFMIASMGLFKSSNIDSLRKNFPRVEEAAIHTDSYLKQICNKKGLNLPLKNIFIQVFKDEKIMEVWGKNEGEWQLIVSYPICFIPGHLGPKIKQGDQQVPEGWYKINSINPKSEFHLSMQINYPNEADLVRSKNEKDPGGDIFIHGNCVSVGCIPIEDIPMEEFFWLTVQSIYAYPDQAIQVLMLPFDLNNESKYKKMTKQYPEYYSFWEELKSLQVYFEEFREIPNVTISPDGHYYILID
ncbi:MAG: L,D-transpeptidase family protein [Chitinophagales bacterium]|nr:L,D-transpeptidase family protein [Chitinophagales bacterium]